MSKFVLIHGAWHGKWCWDKVVPLLEAEGHEVFALDLPGHGEDKTPVAEVTLQSYTDRVCEMLDALSEPVTLVGHSLSGTVISQAAEQRPEKIETLVYLSAFLLPSGRSAIETSQEDKESVILSSVEVDEENGRIELKDEGIAAFYNDCSEEDIERAKRMITAQPLAPFGTPVEVTEENFGSVRRTYIESLNDKAVGPAMQKKLYTELPCEKVVSMETGHMAFAAAPEELTKNLASLAKA